MLDGLAILLSCGGCVYVAWRACRLDKTLPWFTPLGRARRVPGRATRTSGKDG